MTTRILSSVGNLLTFLLKYVKFLIIYLIRSYIMNSLSHLELNLITANLPKFCENKEKYLENQKIFIQNIELQNNYDVITEIQNKEAINNFHPITLTKALKIAFSRNNLALVNAFFINKNIERIISREDYNLINEIIIWAAQSGYLSLIKLIAQNQDLIRDIENQTLKQSFETAFLNKNMEIVDFLFTNNNIKAKIYDKVEIIIQDFLTNELSIKNLPFILNHSIFQPFITQEVTQKIIRLSFENNNLTIVQAKFGAKIVNNEIKKIIIEAFSKVKISYFLPIVKIAKLMSPKLKKKIIKLL